MPPPGSPPPGPPGSGELADTPDVGLVPPGPAAGLPRIAIVGRPNVGKSTLLNRMCGSRVSIVEPTAGVTRDRIAVVARLDDPHASLEARRAGRTRRAVEVVDTGGIGIVDRDDLGPHVEEQVRAALSDADLVLFLVDARTGLTPLDAEVAERLRGTALPVVLVVNKAEGARQQWEVDAFRRLGVGEGPFAISAQNGEGLEELYERVLSLLPERSEAEDLASSAAPVLKIAVVGRRNAGKSTLINALAREERMIVSEVPGTTRDAVDVRFERDGRGYVVIDTAGVRRKKSIADAIEFYSDARSHKAIRRADVVILLFDGTEDLSSIEKRLARYVVDHHKPVILAANKWDLVRGRMKPEELRQYLDDELPGLRFAPLARLSARDGWRVQELFDLALELDAEARARVGTGELNRVLQEALAARSPSSKGHRVKVLYATQAERTPPTFVLFVNDRRLIGKSWLRYLENRLRADLPFGRVPVHIVLRDRGAEDSREGRS